jgi:hypothetical protein
MELERGKMKQFAIDEKLANDILYYLANRPMIEVEGFVNGLRRLKEIKIEEPKTEKIMEVTENGN